MICITTTKIGIVYSRNLDEHGVNVMYTHANSSVSPDRSDGSRHMTMNGAFTSGTAKQHPAVQLMMHRRWQRLLNASMQQTMLLHSEVSLVNLGSNGNPKLSST